MSDKAKTIHIHKNRSNGLLYFAALLIPSLVFTIIVMSFGKDAKIKSSSVESISPTPEPRAKIIFEATQITVDIADTPKKRQIGLSGREALGENEGMLFVYGRNDIFPASFWMKDMLFALDMIWVDDGRVVQIEEKVPPESPGTPEREMKIYPSKQPFDYFIEVNSGFVEKNNIQTGSKVQILTSL